MSGGLLLDMLILITLVIGTLHGWRVGAVVSLISLLSIPIGLGVAWYWGPALAVEFVHLGFPFPILPAYALLFFGTIVVLHLIAEILRALIHSFFIFAFADEAIGAVVGFVKVWLLWLLFLVLWGSVLTLPLHIAGLHTVNTARLQQDYNSIVTTSIFAHINQAVVHPVRGAQQ
jgi:uncharacterized membrane protein required for colicin V production